MRLRIRTLNKKGFTKAELLVVVALISTASAVGMPQYGKFAARDRVRQAANELIQNMRLTRAMAIKENRAYTMAFYPANSLYMTGFDANSDGDLLDANDTFGNCNDTNNDRLPDDNGDRTVNGLGSVRECVKVVDLNTHGEGIVRIATEADYDPADAALAANGCNNRTACFGSSTSPIRVVFNANGSVSSIGTVYFEHSDSNYSYCVRVSTRSGAINLWAWNGEEPDTFGGAPIQPATVPNWTEVR